MYIRFFERELVIILRELVRCHLNTKRYVYLNAIEAILSDISGADIKLNIINMEKGPEYMSKNGDTAEIVFHVGDTRHYLQIRRLGRNLQVNFDYREITTHTNVFSRLFIIQKHIYDRIVFSKFMVNFREKL